MNNRVAQIICAIAVQGILGGCEAPGEIAQSNGVAEPEPIVEERPSEMAQEPRLALYVKDYRLVYQDPDEFALDAYFENLGQQPIVVLPSLLHRQYRPLDDTTATYVPFPGPRLSPWKGAFALMPRETRVVRLTGMRDGDGLWALAHGNYLLSLRYFVTENLATNGGALQQELGAPDARVWVGDLPSRPITVRYEPKE